MASMLFATVMVSMATLSLDSLKKRCQVLFSFDFLLILHLGNVESELMKIDENNPKEVEKALKYAFL